MTDYFSVLSSLGYKPVYPQFSCCPLYRNSNNQSALSVNLKDGVFYDFVLQKGGSLRKLLELHGYYGAINNLEYEEKLDPLFDEVLFKWEELNDYCCSYDYFVSRGISEQTLKFFGCIKSPPNGKMSSRICFPIFDEHRRLYGLSGRSLEKNPKVKWKNLGRSKHFVSIWHRNEYGTAIIANSIQREKSVYLVESLGDQMSLFDSQILNVAPTFGLKVHAKLICTLIRLQVEKVYICFNNDAEVNRGMEAAKNQKARLKSFWDEKSIIIKIPHIIGDFNDMTKQQITEWKNSESFSE